MSKSKYISFVADTKESANLFDQVDIGYLSIRKNLTFYFRVPSNMTGDDLIYVLEGELNHRIDITGEWDSEATKAFTKIVKSKS